MSESKSATARFLSQHPFCIFCGGSKPATSREHCPPRSLFDNRVWPEGFEFAACADCNGGSSDEDMLVAFLSHMDPLNDQAPTSAGLGLFRRVRSQRPAVLDGMRMLSPTEARRAARKVGLKPKQGEAYADLPLVKIPAELDDAVRTFAAKLTKATFFMQTGKIFPTTGGILFHWFTNAALLATDGSVSALDVFAPMQAVEPVLKRNGADLSAQFGLKLSLGEEGTLFVVQAVFRRSFGFICVASTQPGKTDGFLAQAKAASQRERGPFVSL